MTSPLSRRTLLRSAAGVAAAGIARTEAAPVNPCPTRDDTFGLLKRGKRIPLIFDTDIGGDIDDTWALCFALQCPELDVKLIATDAGNTTYRARIVAKLLEVYGRTDIPVAVGIPPGDKPGHQSEWIREYPLTQFPGTVHEDGVAAIIETINRSPDPVTVMCIGAVPNIKAALERDPGIVKNARFVGMHGSVRRGYGNGSKPAAEANVRSDPPALRAVFAAPWECTVTPLDTCDRVRLKGEKYQRVYRCNRPGIRALMENYRVWNPSWTRRPEVTKASTTLFDTVAVYLTFSEELLVMEDLPLSVTDEGRTVIDDSARKIRCAMDWRELGAFEDLLVSRLVGP